MISCSHDLPSLFSFLWLPAGLRHRTHTHHSTPPHTVCFCLVSTSLLAKDIYLALASDESLKKRKIVLIQWGVGWACGKLPLEENVFINPELISPRRNVWLTLKKKLWNQIFLYSGKHSQKSRCFLPIWLSLPLGIMHTVTMSFSIELLVHLTIEGLNCKIKAFRSLFLSSRGKNFLSGFRMSAGLPF